MNCRVKYPTPGGPPAPAKPFASIIVEKDDSNNKIKVIAPFLLTRDSLPQGAAFGLALDGSRSMTPLYGSCTPWDSTANFVEPVAKTMLKFLAESSGTGEVELAYWAVGTGGKEVEDVGAITQDQIDSLTIRPKKSFGNATYLLPIVKHFVEGKLKDAPWAMVVILTDGKFDDMKDVVNWTEQYAIAVHAGKQKFVKLVLIGLGERDDVDHLEELDDFQASADVQVWCSMLAGDMKELSKIFVDVAGDVVIAPSVKIIDDTGLVLKAYHDDLPTKMEFQLKPGSTKFKLEIPGIPTIEQDLTEALNLLKQKLRYTA